MRAGVSPVAINPNRGRTIPLLPATPVMGHRKCKGDAKLLAADTNSAIHNSFKPAVGLQRCCGTTLAQGFSSLVPAENGNGFFDFDVWGFEFK